MTVQGDSLQTTEHLCMMLWLSGSCICIWGRVAGSVPGVTGRSLKEEAATYFGVIRDRRRSSMPPFRSRLVYGAAPSKWRSDRRRVEAVASLDYGLDTQPNQVIQPICVAHR